MLLPHGWPEPVCASASLSQIRVSKMVDMSHPLVQYIAGEIRVQAECRRSGHKASFCPIAPVWRAQDHPSSAIAVIGLTAVNK